MKFENSYIFYCLILNNTMLYAISHYKENLLSWKIFIKYLFQGNILFAQERLAVYGTFRIHCLYYWKNTGCPKVP